MDLPVEKKFQFLCQITRASHFAWREAVVQMCPDVDILKVVDKMWELTGVETAKSYLKRIDKSKPLPPQIAQSIVFSSVTMGEDAKMDQTEGGEEAFVIHDGCPWRSWHEKIDILHEDKEGCDVWFKTLVAEIAKATGVNVKVETLKSLPDGDEVCLRRIYVEE